MYFGPGNNTVYDTDDGQDEENLWHGQGGQDYLRSLPCLDVVEGDADPDNVGGGSADDSVHGGVGNDYVYGGAGYDNVFGDSGQDRLFDQETGDGDILDGGGHDDFLVDGRDGDGSDKVDGGAGTDNCEWDSGDTHPNCRDLRPLSRQNRPSPG